MALIKFYVRFKAPKPDYCENTWCTSTDFVWIDGDWVCKKCETVQSL